MSCFSRRASGQSTVEAAVMLPVVMLLLALLVQPACLLYTRSIMHGAAAETARAVLTARGESDLSECKMYVRRRLSAIPEVSPFHVGGKKDWKIKISQKKEGVVKVSIKGHARPLPFFGAIASSLLGRDKTGVVLEVSVTERMRPSWLEGDYGTWVDMWG